MSADPNLPDRFNAFILRSVDLLLRERAGGGYDLRSYFTRDLIYGPLDGRVRANAPPLTMCVAAVAEVIIEALNLYYQGPRIGRRLISCQSGPGSAGR